MAAFPGIVGYAAFEMQLWINILPTAQLELGIKGIDIVKNVDMYEKAQCVG